MNCCVKFSPERDYLVMPVFKGAQMSIRFPKNIHLSRYILVAVLKRFKKSLREYDFRASVG